MTIAAPSGLEFSTLLESEAGKRVTRPPKALVTQILAGTAQLHRTATYMCCLRCAGTPKRPATGSGLSLDTPSWHAILYDPGEFGTHKFQSRDVGVGLHRVLTGSALPKLPQIRFTRAVGYRGFLVHSFATACQFACPPVRI
jgi:hypothetical protein